MDISIATARTYASAGKILKDIRLKLPVILMNGVLIFNPLTKAYEKINKLDECDAKLIIETKNKLGLDCFMYTIENNDMHTYYEKLSTQAMVDFHGERVEKYYKSFEQTENFLLIKSDIIYFTFIDSKENLEPFYDALRGNQRLEVTFYNDVYTDGLWYLEVFSAAASKKNGILWLKGKYGFEEIFSFGDNKNDLPMFEISDRKFAVENADETVLNACDKVIESNDRDGVAKELIKLWKGNLHE